MTHTFGRVYGLGSTPWYKDEAAGCMRGNPSVSSKVSSYMLGLRNRKARSGEVPSTYKCTSCNISKPLITHKFK